MYTSRLLFLFFVINTNVLLSLQDKVKVSLYYEALCPFCEVFIKDQLYPGYQVLGDAITVELVPYGNAQRHIVDGEWSIRCQHGPFECYDNKIQACVLANNTQKESMDFIGCLATKENPYYAKKAEECANQASLSWEDINSCANGDKGTELLVRLGEKTDSLVPRLEYVPSIWFNDVFDKDVESAARRDFVGTVCGKFKEKPAACTKYE